MRDCRWLIKRLSCKFRLAGEIGVCNANSASATLVASQHQRRIEFRSLGGLSIRLFR